MRAVLEIGEPGWMYTGASRRAALKHELAVMECRLDSKPPWAAVMEEGGEERREGRLLTTRRSMASSIGQRRTEGTKMK